MSSGKLDKYEYLTGEDLGYRPDPLQKANSEYRPLGQVFNKGLTTDEKSDCLSIKDKKISNTKKFKFRYANVNEIKELSYLVDDIEDSIEKYIEGKISSIQTSTTRDGKHIYKNYNFSDYTNLWSLIKKIFEGKLSIKKARKQQNYIEKKITELHNSINHIGPGRKMNLSTKKSLEDLYSNARNLYIVRKDIINEMFNTEDEKLDIATGSDDEG